MPEIDTFQPEKRTLGQLLSSTSPPIRVPDFQRDYSWESEQIEEFWEDLVAFGAGGPTGIAGKEYFLGAAVLVNNGTFHLLLDGQQRLATTTIMLAALRDKIYEFNDNAARQIQDQYIAFQDHLTSERVVKIQLNVFDRAFFRDYVQSLPRVENIAPTKKSHSLIQKAYEYFANKISDGWQQAGGGKKGFEWAAYVTQIVREHMALVTVVSTNERSAASIFTTLNDRGIGLSTTDLIRSFILQSASEESREEIIQCWEKTLEACGSAIAAEGVIRLSWVAEHGDIKARALYKVVEAAFKEGTSPVAYSRRLRDDAILLRQIRDADNEDSDLQEYWSGIRILKANAAQTLLIAAYHKLSPEEQKCLARALVALAVRHNIVCQLDRSRYESTVYDTARQVSGGASFEVALNELRKISPSADRFTSDFASLAFSTAEHAIARYLLTAIEDKMAPTDELSVAGSSKVHVEHIYPQTPPDDYRWQQHADYIGRLGNLTLLDKRLNQGIKNASFKDKKVKAYNTSKLELTKKLLLCEDDWLPESVDQRQKELGEIAAKIWSATLD